MANKQITELDVSTGVGLGDTFILRKSGAIEDTQISYTNFVKTMGSPAIDGFRATSGGANEITLTPSNNALVDTYYDGMRVTFVSPVTSTGLVQMQIGSLPMRDFWNYNTTTSVDIEEDDFIEAVYLGDYATGRFYRTNPATNTIFSNEYTAVGTVAGDESSTEYALTSAIGITKTSYYLGMSLIFTTDVASKGAVYVNVDGLGNKALTDGPNDEIANDLLANQTILATYDGTKFTKNIFTQEVPAVPDMPAEVIEDATDPETGVVDPVIVIAEAPPVNKQDVNVGPSGQYTTITAAISDLVKNFGPNGGNKQCTVNLNSDFTWTEKLELAPANYGWITIKAYSSGTVISGTARINFSNGGIAPNLTGTFQDARTSTTTPLLALGKSASCIVSGATFNSTNGNYFYNSGSELGNLTIINSTLNGYLQGIRSNHGSAQLTITGSYITNTINNAIFMPTGGYANIKDTVISSSNATTEYLVLFEGQTTADNLQVIGTNRTRTLYQGYQATYKNCRVAAQPGGQCIYVYKALNVTLDGGDYKNTSNGTENSNIVVAFSNLYLKNSPQGGTSTVGSGSTITTV